MFYRNFILILLCFQSAALSFAQDGVTQQPQPYICNECINSRIDDTISTSSIPKETETGLYCPRCGLADPTKKKRRAGFLNLLNRKSICVLALTAGFAGGSAIYNQKSDITPEERYALSILNAEVRIRSSSRFSVVDDEVLQIGLDLQKLGYIQKEEIHRLTDKTDVNLDFGDYRISIRNKINAGELTEKDAPVSFTIGKQIFLSKRELKKYSAPGELDRRYYHPMAGLVYEMIPIRIGDLILDGDYEELVYVPYLNKGEPKVIYDQNPKRVFVISQGPGSALFRLKGPAIIFGAPGFSRPDQINVVSSSWIYLSRRDILPNNIGSTIYSSDGFHGRILDLLSQKTWTERH